MQQFSDLIAQRSLRRGAEVLHARGPNAMVEAFAEVARRIGGLPAIVSVLQEIERRPRPPRRRGIRR
jgi:hypothetical protein